MAHLRCDVFSDALGLSTSITVLLPQAASGRIGMAGAAPDRDPPVLYLLHGLSDDDTTWVRRTSIERYVAPLGLAVVLPQVHRSYYLDGVATGRYWTWVAEELPALVQRLFRVSDRREDTFVAGLSMGGYGAMRLALHQPARFAAAASMSGVLDLPELRRARPDDEVLTPVLGDRDVTGSDDDLLAVLGRADVATLPRLHVSCGTDDALLPHSERFVAAARDRGGLDVTTSFPAGGHDWAVWDGLIQEVLAWLPLDGAGGPTDPPIEAAATSTTGFVGPLPSGPVDEPELVTSLRDAERVFGAVRGDGGVGDALALFFTNGGGRAVVVRTAGDAAADLVGDATVGTGVHALTGAGCALLCLPTAATLPDADVAATLRAAVAWCAEEGAVLVADAAPGLSTAAEVVAWAERHVPRGPDVAVYAPWLLVPDRDGGAPRAVAPSGAVAGVFARNDARRGVWKAPAGIEASLAGVVGTSASFGAEASDELASHGINPVRRISGRGLLLWGARTRDDGELRHLPVRRLALLVERSVAAGLDWTAPLPGEPATWARIEAAVDAFVARLFRDGAFAGATAEEAYVVRCDATTTTPADVAAGVANVVIGLAPVRPAEFVIIRIGLQTTSPSA